MQGTFKKTLEYARRLKHQKIREEKGLMQKEIAAVASMHPANYNKVEKGEREPSIDALDKIAKFSDWLLTS